MDSNSVGFHGKRAMEMSGVLGTWDLGLHDDLGALVRSVPQTGRRPHGQIPAYHTSVRSKIHGA